MLVGTGVSLTARTFAEFGEFPLAGKTYPKTRDTVYVGLCSLSD